MSKSGLLCPATCWLERVDGVRHIFYSQPAVFNGDRFTIQQHVTNSKDGTPIDYVVLSPEDTGDKVGKAPVLITAYGIMGISIMIRYMDLMLGGISLVPWLERGGSLVIALVRGGGEREPDWHEAARQTKRQNSYEDFIAVSKELIRSWMTAAEHLGVFGVSSGGLLSAVVGIQRPDLFGVVVSDVPMTDMLRYPKMGMGGAWIDEYGDPEDPEMANVLRAYSPFHNVR